MKSTAKAGNRKGTFYRGGVAEKRVTVLASVKGCFGMYEALWTLVEQEADGSCSSIASSSLCNGKMLRLVF